MLRQVCGRGNPGRKSSKVLQDCTICVSCRCTGPCWIVPRKRENRSEWREFASYQLTRSLRHVTCDMTLGSRTYARPRAQRREPSVVHQLVHFLQGEDFPARSEKQLLHLAQHLDALPSPDRAATRPDSVGARAGARPCPAEPCPPVAGGQPQRRIVAQIHGVAVVPTACPTSRTGRFPSDLLTLPLPNRDFSALEAILRTRFRRNRPRTFSSPGTLARSGLRFP